MYRKESEGWFKHIDFILIDMICLQVAFYLAYVLKGLGVNPYADLVYRNMAIVIEFADLAAMFMLDTLTHVTLRGRYRELIATAGNVLAVGLIGSAYLFFMQEGAAFSRLMFGIALVLYFVFAYASRFAWKKVLASGKWERNCRSLLIVTTKAEARKVVETVQANNYGKFLLSGLVIVDADMAGQSIAGVKVVANSEDAPMYVCQQWIDEVLVVVPDEDPYPEELIKKMEETGVTIHLKMSKIADAKITIATSKSQASAIKNQLGEKASICVEPCRRDTFPAIALAAAYLRDELGVGTDEAVVVCPVDPYVDNTYYEAVKTLQELAEKGNANLTLMGIEPTYPSEKYGYIIPESGENVSKVKEFKEKPDVETAKKYLAQSALWNAGIFAFKLGYLLDKAHSMIDFEDYRDLFNKYDTLTKISFDYAVVEKEFSIQVLRYSGDWKDVGTWNMMAEVMADKTKGKAILDETCENTNVVNELNIPILCMGCKDMIVAASGDGILISDKERSGYMKPYVEKIETEAMYAEKSWGTYTVIDVQPGSMTVKISMKAGENMSYHMHNYREEVWTVVSGKGKATVDGMEQVLRTGDVITIAAGCKHTVEAITALDMIEVQLGDEISVADKIKFPME